MGRCPKPRKFFEKNLTKNFHTGKVFGVHIRSNIVLLEFYASGRILSSRIKKIFACENLPNFFNIY